MFKFKPEDFSDSIDTRDHASQANHILQAHLATLPRVYGREPLEDVYWAARDVARSTHTALLWGITEIEKECEHEPKEIHSVGLPYTTKNECRFCGVKLKAKWEKA